MASPMIPRHLTLSGLERSSQGHSGFEGVYLVKGLARTYVTIKH